MLGQKCQKRYETDGASVDLLLYYWRQSPYDDAINDCFTNNAAEIGAKFLSSQFNNVWIYDMGTKKVLWRAQR